MLAVLLNTAVGQAAVPLTRLALGTRAARHSSALPVVAVVVVQVPLTPRTQRLPGVASVHLVLAAGRLPGPAALLERTAATALRVPALQAARVAVGAVAQ